MLHPLAGVIEKLRRTDEHLRLLHTETARYLNDNPNAIVLQRDAGNGEPGFVFRVTKEPPLRLSIIVGDIVQNMRSALDYIAHELTIANGATPGRTTQFPVSLDEDDFIHQAITLRKLNFVSMKALKRVSLLQPYRDAPEDRRNHPLHLLTKLSNIDKHHALVLTAFAGEGTTVLTYPDGKVTDSDFRSKLYDGTIVASIPREAFDSNVKMRFKADCFMTFKETGFRDREVLATLNGIRYFLGDAVIGAIQGLFQPLPDGLRLTAHGISLDSREITERPVGQGTTSDVS